jgi:hypothetical protein
VTRKKIKKGEDLTLGKSTIKVKTKKGFGTKKLKEKYKNLKKKGKGKAKLTVKKSKIKKKDGKLIKETKIKKITRKTIKESNKLPLKSKRRKLRLGKSTKLKIKNHLMVKAKSLKGRRPDIQSNIMQTSPVSNRSTLIMK